MGHLEHIHFIVSCYAVFMEILYCKVAWHPRVLSPDQSSTNVIPFITKLSIDFLRKQCSYGACRPVKLSDHAEVVSLVVVVARQPRLPWRPASRE